VQGGGDTTVVNLPPSEANQLSPGQLRIAPFFGAFEDDEAEFPDWDGGDWLYGSDPAPANAHLPPVPTGGASLDNQKNHAKRLAEAIPARSDAAGANAIGVFPDDNNINLDVSARDPAFWPDRDTSNQNDRWLHSDYLVPSLPHVFDLYEDLVFRRSLVRRMSVTPDY